MQVQLQRHQSIVDRARDNATRREKDARGAERKSSCDDARRLSRPAISLEIASKDVDHNMAVGEVVPGTKWRRVKSSQRKTTAIDLGARARILTPTEFPAFIMRRVWTIAHWNRKRPLIHTGNSHTTSVTVNDDDDDDADRDDATFPISPKHSPSRGTARRAMSPVISRDDFSEPRDAYRINPARD